MILITSGRVLLFELFFFSIRNKLGVRPCLEEKSGMKKKMQMRRVTK